jgi:hypothetical protein
MRHPHPDRVAELYRRDPTHTSGLRWVGYSAGPGHADHPAGAVWNEQLQAWVIEDTK